MVSNLRRSFPVSPSSARHCRRLRGRARLVAISKAWRCDSELGPGDIRGQSGVGHGLGISRQHRSGDGDVARLLCLDVFARSTDCGGSFLFAELSDQYRAAAAAAGIRALLGFTTSTFEICHTSRYHSLPVVVRTAVPFSAAFREERSRLRQLLGNLGIHLLPAFNRPT